MILSLILAAAVTTAPATAQEDHVPKLSDIKPLDPRVEKVQHIAAVNVGGAVPKEDFERIVPFISKRMLMNLWPRTLTSSATSGLLSDGNAIKKLFGEKAVAAVFMEDSDEPNAYLAVPGLWCRVNIRHLKVDKPDERTLRDRTAKAFLRGLAYASGAGAALDNRGVTSANVHNVKDLDKVFITVTPETLMSMHQNLMTGGSGGVLSPPMDGE